MNYRIVEKIHQDPYTMVKIETTININGKKIKLEGVGFTKRNSCDAPNPQIGAEVAETRAKEMIRKKRNEIKKALKKQLIEN